MKIMLTIVTVCFNSCDTIERCVKSVVNQMNEEIEYLIIDGLSSDGTAQIVQKYVGKHIRLISEKDKGIYDAMNKGIFKAQGEWIWFINSDDYIEAGLIDIILSSLKKYSDYDCLYGNMGYVRNINGKQYEEIKKAPEQLSQIRNEMVIGHPSTICKTSRIRAINGFCLKYKIAADWDLLLRLYNTDSKFKHIDVTLARFYTGGASSKSHIRERHRVRRDNKSYKVIDFYAIKDVIKVVVLFCMAPIKNKILINKSKQI